LLTRRRAKSKGQTVSESIALIAEATYEEPGATDSREGIRVLVRPGT
jgi:hypothetical protein